MNKNEIIKAVCHQVINMLDNDIICDRGPEGFIGWLEGGEVYRCLGMSEEDVEKAMALSRVVASKLDYISLVDFNVNLD